MTILAILIISFIASLVRSTLGFGEALIAVPFFLLFLPVEVAVPLAVMLSIVIALVVVIQDHKKIHFHSAKWLIIYPILGLPSLVIYWNLRQWSAKHFRATLQAYFLPVSLLSVVGYYAKGLLTTEVNIYFLYSLITTIPAIFLGRYLNHKLKDGTFFKYVYWGLMLISVVLIISALL